MSTRQAIALAGAILAGYLAAYGIQAWTEERRVVRHEACISSCTQDGTTPILWCERVCHDPEPHLRFRKAGSFKL